MAAVKKKKTAVKKTGSSVSAGKTAGKSPGAVSRRNKAAAKGSNVTKPEKKKVRAAADSVAKKTAGRKKAGKKQTAKPDRLHELRRSLLDKREAIIKEAKDEIAKYISGENRQLVDTALDEGDLAVVDISEDVNLMRLASHRQNLLDIDEALRKIDDGSYGICEECGEEIGEKRLNVLPTATLCRNCQDRKEKLEAIGKVQSGL
ncbi:MAG: TraR/DksA C4-type zinc finger protein [Candidatus Sulfobium sp.]|jgi:RNA polymerase-binding transcription factor